MENTSQITFEKIFETLKKRIWWILIIAVIVGCGAAVYGALFIKDTYTCKLVYRIGVPSEMTSGEINQLDYQVKTSIQTLQTRRVMTKVVTEARIVTSNGTPAVQEMMNATKFAGDETTGSFSISVSSTNPEVAHKMVLAFHKLLTDDEYVVNELELKKMYPVVEPDGLPTSPSNGSRTAKYGALGALLGAVLAGVFFLLRAVMDVTIRSEKDLRECSALPILGTLPYYEGTMESGEQLLKKADK